MPRILIAALLLACSPGAARAESFDLHELFSRAEQAIQQITGATPPDREVIPAPADMDRQMAVVPRGPGGTLQIITPPRR